MIAMLTITIITLICATSLYVISQDSTATTQTTAWQQALAGAEAAVDHGINALNTGVWTNVTGNNDNWYTVTGSLPTSKPRGGSTANAVPGNDNYNYYFPPSLSLQGEACNSVSMWVTIDNANLPLDTNGNQAYRIRGTGQVGAPGPRRVSNQKMDNDLRKISLIYDRLSGAAVTGGQPMATRRIEVVVVPTAQSMWVRGLLAQHQIQMSGGGWIDSFDSSSGFKSTNGLYDVTKRQSHGDIATNDSVSADLKTFSDLRNTYVYGSIQYSGPAIKNITNVQGTVSTPFATDIPIPADPSWASGTYTTVAAGNPGTLNPGTKSHPALYKMTGNFTVPGGNVLNIPAINPGTDNNYVTLWVKGSFTISGSGYVNQGANVHVTYYLDGDVTVSGSAFLQAGTAYASNNQMIAVGTGNTTPTLTVSGSGNYIGTIWAPIYGITVSGTANLSGAFIGNNINISGGASVHYDEALKNLIEGNSTGNFAFASWFEDNSDPARGIIY